MEFLRHCFLPRKEMLVELPLLSYLPLLISSTFISDGFIFRELPLQLDWIPSKAPGPLC